MLWTYVNVCFHIRSKTVVNESGERITKATVKICNMQLLLWVLLRKKYKRSSHLLFKFKYIRYLKWNLYS